MSETRILMIALLPPPYSSGERVVNEKVRRLLADHYPVETLNVSTGALNSEQRGQRLRNQWASLRLYWKAARAAKRRQRREGFEVLYLVSPSSSFGHLRDWLLLRYLSRPGLRTLVFVHNGNYDDIFKKSWHRGITRDFFARIQRIVFLSEGLRAKVVPYLPAAQCAVLSNSVETEVAASAGEMAQKWQQHRPDPLQILYLSNMNPTKGYMDLAAAIVQLRQEGMALRARFVGDWLSAQQRADFEAYLAEHGIADCVEVLGKVSDRAVVKRLLLESSVFVLPTYFPQEAQPMSILEALSAGTPVVATRHASIPEYISEGENGFLVEKKSPESVAGALRRLQDAETWLRLSKGARSAYEARFSEAAYREQLYRLVEGD